MSRAEEPITPEFAHQYRKARNLVNQQNELNYACLLVKVNLTREKVLNKLSSQKPSFDFVFYGRDLTESPLDECAGALEEFVFGLVDRRCYDFSLSVDKCVQLVLSIRLRESVEIV